MSWMQVHVLNVMHSVCHACSIACFLSCMQIAIYTNGCTSWPMHAHMSHMHADETGWHVACKQPCQWSLHLAMSRNLARPEKGTVPFLAGPCWVTVWAHDPICATQDLVLHEHPWHFFLGTGTFHGANSRHCNYMHAGKVPYLLLHVQLGFGVEELPTLRMRVRSQSTVPFLECQCETQVLRLTTIKLKTVGKFFSGKALSCIGMPWRIAQPQI